jgi:RNA polymerase sigma factor (TIGR02999 family)
MTTPSAPQINQLLENWRNGDTTALDQLMPLVYEELHRLAHHYMRGERAGHTLQTSALVNEAYLRLLDRHRPRLQNRAHFFAVSAQAMRRILVEHARSRQREKRGGKAQRVTLDESCVLSADRSLEILALEDALGKLAVIDPRKAQVVELRYFGGLNNAEVADVLKISANTVMRDWNMAQAWLFRELSRD